MDQLAARTKYLKKVESTLASFNSKFEDLVKSLGWTVESLTKNTKGFDDNAAEDQNSEKFPEEEETQKEYVAESQDYEKIYNDLVANLPNQANKNSDKSQTQILAEMLELERNTKRRRISYKNKVHTRNKSQTEVLRALVQEQMDVLKDLAGQTKEDDPQAKATNQQLEADPGGLIQVNTYGGNPHTAWKRIDELLQDAQGTSEKRKSSSFRASPSPENQRKRHRDDQRYSRHDRDRNKRHDLNDDHDRHGDRYKDRGDHRDRDRSRNYKERHTDRRDGDHKVSRHRKSHHDDVHSDDSRDRQRSDRRNMRDDRDSHDGKRRHDRRAGDTSNDEHDHRRSGRYWQDSAKNEEYGGINRLSTASKASEYNEDRRYSKPSNDSDSSYHQRHMASNDEKPSYPTINDDKRDFNAKKSSISTSDSDTSSDSKSEKSSAEKKSRKRKKKKKKKEKRKKKRRRSRSST
ncbi:Hypothetical protein NTJ_10600 [Nesidiocoris tenuis]|uniref:Uncharacterized protein n=1 Tax=Nesidiocoris tenuis TaxID=355587 RepID=A0ABN7B3P8_9HEMI|nr:Hypothetical protein NTJ_10600 [Nesidiocoris tenuis]